MELLKEYHDTIMTHQGNQRTFEAIQARYFWPGMRRDIRDYIVTCMECQTHGEKPDEIPLKAFQSRERLSTTG